MTPGVYARVGDILETARSYFRIPGVIRGEKSCPYIRGREVPCERGYCKPETCLTLAAHTDNASKRDRCLQL